eukprot:c56087_g1_i1 orf=284-685(+)
MRKFAMHFETVLQASTFFERLKEIIATEKLQHGHTYPSSEIQPKDSIVFTSVVQHELGQLPKVPLQPEAGVRMQITEQQQAHRDIISMPSMGSINQKSWVQLPPRFPGSTIQSDRLLAVSRDTEEKDVSSSNV